MIRDGLLSPNFRSAAAMAGWDEEALLFATLIVEDTPVRESARYKKRPSSHQSKTPPTTNSNSRKRRNRRDSTVVVSPVVLRMDEEEEESKGAKEKQDSGASSEEKEREEGVDPGEKETGKGIRCLDKLREELSCAICLEICFEPSTTSCGHSFCLKCLKCAAAKCGKRCPKCRQLISTGRSCTINTVLWNTIQLLFPEEVEAKKNSPIATSKVRETTNNENNHIEEDEDRRNTSRSNSSRRIRRRSTQISQAVERDRSARRREVPDQSEDAAMAFRLQREEFMVAFRHRGTQVHQSDAFNTSRANLRAIASRVHIIRNRDRSSNFFQ